MSCFFNYVTIFLLPSCLFSFHVLYEPKKTKAFLWFLSHHSVNDMLWYKLWSSWYNLINPFIHVMLSSSFSVQAVITERFLSVTDSFSLLDVCWCFHNSSLLLCYKCLSLPSDIAFHKIPLYLLVILIKMTKENMVQ